MTAGRARDTLASTYGDDDQVDHLSLRDPMTWVMVLAASLLIAGLRWLMRGRSTPPDRPPSGEEPDA